MCYSFLNARLGAHLLPGSATKRDSFPLWGSRILICLEIEWGGQGLTMLVISVHRLRPREEVEAGIQVWVALPGDVPSTQLGVREGTDNLWCPGFCVCFCEGDALTIKQA